MYTEQPITTATFGSFVKVGTHDGAFHFDEVAAIAALKKIIEVEVVRTRDPKVLATCTVRVDVGGKYSPATGDFDHHQGKLESRSSGVPYSAFGLVWKTYGTDICGGNEEVASIVDKALVEQADALDNGYPLWDKDAPVRPYTVSHMVSAMNPGWNSITQDFDYYFNKAIEIVGAMLEYEIHNAWGIVEAREQVVASVKQSQESGLPPQIVILERFCPWQAHMALLGSECLYVVFPAVTKGQWNCQAVPDKPGSFACKRPLPMDWANAAFGTLANVTGVADVVFCHKGRFICGAGSREGAIDLARKAMA